MLKSNCTRAAKPGLRLITRAPGVARPSRAAAGRTYALWVSARGWCGALSRLSRRAGPRFLTHALKPNTISSEYGPGWFTWVDGVPVRRGQGPRGKESLTKRDHHPYVRTKLWMVSKHAKVDQRPPSGGQESNRECTHLRFKAASSSFVSRRAVVVVAVLALRRLADCGEGGGAKLVPTDAQVQG